VSIKGGQVEVDMADIPNGHNGERDEEEEEEEEIDETAFKPVKDAVLFVIEVSSSMLEVRSAPASKKATSDSATSAALKCAYALMQQRIISHPNDMMGILLFGTEQSKFQEDEHGGSFQYPNCYLLSDLDVPAATDVKRLRSMVEDEEEAKKLLIPAEKQVAMANVLFCANQIFTTKAPNFSSRRIFLVTDNDTPHEEKALRSSAVVRAKDLYDLGVIIELFPISRSGHEFDRTRFYDVSYEVIKLIFQCLYLRRTLSTTRTCLIPKHPHQSFLPTRPCKKEVYPCYSRYSTQSTPKLFPSVHSSPVCH